MKRLRKVVFPTVMSIAALLMTSCSSSKIAYTADVREVGGYHSVRHHRGDNHKSHRGSSPLISEAKSWLGTPYKYASAEKGCGTDCSGMVTKVYQKATGCALPRSSAKMAEYCTPVRPEDVESGDLVFFATGSDPNRVSHVGIMVDTETFIHASSSKGVVESSMLNPYYQRTFLMYGRVPSVAALR
ncbi:MAG: C40 family peptidase [Bacteroidales bacterium]|nr:C40 family peptidase [Bacteroidales bacterium]